jgi:hypothetical protein
VCFVSGFVATAAGAVLSAAAASQLTGGGSCNGQ